MYFLLIYVCYFFGVVYFIGKLLIDIIRLIIVLVLINLVLKLRKL